MRPAQPLHCGQRPRHRQGLTTPARRSFLALLVGEIQRFWHARNQFALYGKPREREEAESIRRSFLVTKRRRWTHQTLFIEAEPSPATTPGFMVFDQATDQFVETAAPRRRESRQFVGYHPFGSERRLARKPRLRGHNQLGKGKPYVPAGGK